MTTPRIAIAHDYLSTPGGAERVIEVLAAQFPAAPIYTSVFDPSFYPTIDPARVHTSWLNKVPFLRSHYRSALPFLPSAFRRLHVAVTDADVVVCSTTGWAHAINADIPKVAYCNNPARWLYQPEDYFRGRHTLRTVMRPLLWWLRRFDQRAARSCASYIGNSRGVTARINAAYDIDADTLSPPSSFTPDGPQHQVVGVPTQFFLCVGRLISYKRVDVVVEAFRSLPHLHLVVVGDGPMADDLRRSAPHNVNLVGSVDDNQLRWLYHQATALVSASSEDFGLTPVEAAMCGTPSVLLRAGGFLDTGIDGTNAVFFDTPQPAAIAAAITACTSTRWDRTAIVATADRYSINTFISRLTEIAAAAASTQRP